MELDYSSLLSPNPIPLSIGITNRYVHLRKPTLKEIDEKITFQQFGLYKMFLKMSPMTYYTKIIEHQENNLWDSLSEEEKNEITLFECITRDKNLQDVFCEVFNFFIKETVRYSDGFFIFIEDDNESVDNEIYGVIQENNFNDFLSIIQQTCCIYEKDKNTTVKFKNALARKLYEKIQKANEKLEEKKKEKMDKDLSMANIISKVSNRHPSINPITVWDLTVFQLIDSFKALRTNEVYEISKTRVSVWGDEKNTFDEALWYKNNHEE